MTNICPISGKVCNKRKTHHITDLKDGNIIQSVDLCEDCAAQYIGEIAENTPSESIVVNTSADINNPLAKGIFDFFQKIIETVEKQKTIDKTHSCPGCNLSAEEIYTTGKFGCPKCYESFNVENLLMKIHGSSQHVGKVPKRWKLEKERRERENILNNFNKLVENKMSDLLSNEQYETAAKVKQMCENVAILQGVIDDLKEKLRVSSESPEEIKHIQSELDTDIIKCAEMQNEILKI